MDKLVSTEGEKNYLISQMHLFNTSNEQRACVQQTSGSNEQLMVA